MTGGPSIPQWIGIALAIATILLIFLGKINFLGESYYNRFLYGFAFFLGIGAILIGTSKY
jgi:hypothetical protein